MAGIIISGNSDAGPGPTASQESTDTPPNSASQDRRDFSNYLRRERELASRQNQQRQEWARSRAQEERRQKAEATTTAQQQRRDSARIRRDQADQARARKTAQADQARSDRAVHADAIRMNRLHDRRQAEAQRQASRQYQDARKAAAEEDAARNARNPNSYLSGYINTLRSRAAGTMASRDFGALKQIDTDIKQVNETLKSRLNSGSMTRGEYARAQNGVQAAQAAVVAARSTARPGVGGIAGRLAGQFMLARNSGSQVGSLLAGEGVAAGPWGLAIGAGLDALKLGATLPQSVSARMGQWMANSARSRAISHGSLDLGIRNGMSGQFGDIRNVFHQRGRLADWQSRYGVDDLQALQMVQGLGTPINSVSGVRDAGRLLASVPYQSGLMGMSSGAAASILNQGHTLGLSAANARVSGGLAGNNSGFSLRGGFNAQSDQQYLNRFGRVMRQAMAEGLDSSQVAATMTSLVGMSATSGQGYTNASGAFRLASGLMASGDQSMRAGGGILSFQAGINNATQGIGFGGDSMRNTVFHNYFARHGGVPRSMADLRRLGVQTTGLTGAQQSNLNDALTAFRGGNEASGLSLLQPFLSGENGAGILGRVGSDEARFMPQSMQPLFMRNFMGIGTSQYYDYKYGQQYNAAQRRGVVDDRARSLSGRTGIGAQTLADLWSYESGNRSVRGGAGNRYYGVGQVGASALADLKKRYPQEFGHATLQDLQTNPELGRTASALYMQMSLSQNRGNVRAGVNQYLGMTDGGSYTPYQTAERDTLISDMTARAGDASRQMSNTNRAEAAAGHFATDASEQAHEFAPIIAGATQQLARLTGAVDTLTRSVSRLGSNVMGGIGMAPPRVH